MANHQDRAEANAAHDSVRACYKGEDDRTRPRFVGMIEDTVQ